MEALLIIVTVTAIVVAVVAYPNRPQCTVAVSLIMAIFGASGLALVLVGPKDYMHRISSSLTTILHPYILGGVGILLLSLGVGGIIGISIRMLMRTKDFK